MTLDELLLVPAEELPRHSRVGVKLYADIGAMLEEMARGMADEIGDNNRAGRPTRWILPVGPVAQYAPLVEICNRERISWKNVYAFQMDEFLDWQARPIPLEHPLSFEGYMRRDVYGRLDPELRIPEEQTFFPSPFAPDAISEKIRQAGGIDTCFGGVGYHGHIAFNEPPISRWRKISVEQLRNSLTRVVALGDDSIVVQSIMSAGANSAAIPPMAVTLGMRDILASRKIRLYLVGGERHRTVFRITLMGEVTSDYPCTLVQGHPDCIVHTDYATAQPVVPQLR